MQSKTEIVRVIAAIVDDRQLTLYKEDGNTVSILQGDPRLAKIIHHITPILAVPGQVAEVDLEHEAPGNPYKEFEQQNGSGIRFFKVAKAKLSSWLGLGTKEETKPVGAPHVAQQAIGKIPGSPANDSVKKLLSTADEIIANAKPASAPDFHDKDTGTHGSHTVVAVVEKAGKKEVIADVEKLKPQIKRAVAIKDSKGFVTFMERIAAVASKRRHSAEDLLKFMERGDLPIADDGSIVIYKVLRRNGDHYVDCHTRNVSQKVGSYVCMDESLVDHNRNNECSNGLHVARRAYLSGFGGDVCVLAKVRPEDVIAVPSYDANKMRVCGYHILFELSQEAYGKLRANRPFTDNEEAQILLGRALSGDHPEPEEEVRITGQLGQGVKISLLASAKAQPKKVEAKPTETPKPKTELKKVVKAEALPDNDAKEKLSAPKVDPKQVVKEVTKVKAEVESRATKAQRLAKEFKAAKGEDRKAKAQALLEHKKATKLGWKALGLQDKLGEELAKILSK